MDWIFDNLQIVVIIVLALGSWISSRMQAKKQEEQQEQEEAEETEGAETYIPESGWRMPAPSVPPPMSAGAAYDAANEIAAALKHQRDLAERLQQIRATKANTTGGAAATRSRLAAKGKTAATVLAPTTLRGRLNNRGELRRAIVLREVLSPPVGLR